MIANTITGEIFETTVPPLTVKEAEKLKKKEWHFDWVKETAASDRQVFKLTTLENPKIVQGLLSASDKGDHMFAHLIENARFNKGKTKLYAGVPANLIAFTCTLSFLKGYEGWVSFVSKTVLIEHYKKTLGAKIFAGHQLYIDTPVAAGLVKTHFTDFKF